LGSSLAPNTQRREASKVNEVDNITLTNAVLSLYTAPTSMVGVKTLYIFFIIVAIIIVTFTFIDF
jgi:hypothetical protein